MSSLPTAADVHVSLRAHVESKGVELFCKYGPRLGWSELQQVLQDRAFVRYPCEIKFDAAHLQPGEFAYPQQNADTPEQGFTLWVHPLYMIDLAHVSHLVLYQLVVINYGPFASAEDAETFGAAALGLTRDEYYSELCRLADQVCACGGEGV